MSMYYFFPLKILHSGSMYPAIAPFFNIKIFILQHRISEFYVYRHENLKTSFYIYEPLKQV
jgi:hypothetical protein